MHVARPKWVPETDEQRRTAAAVTRAVKRRSGAEEDLWRAVTEAHAAGVPVADLAKAVGVTRDTIYRHLPAVRPEARDSDG